MAEEKVLFVKSAVKDFIKAQDCNTSSTLISANEENGNIALNDLIKDALKKACDRAKKNGRKTVYDRDL